MGVGNEEGGGWHVRAEGEELANAFMNWEGDFCRWG